MPESNASPTVISAKSNLYDLHQIKAFNTSERVRKKLFETQQLCVEIACYEPGQSTVMHQHPFESEAIYVLEGVANMKIGGEELEVAAGSIIEFPHRVLHDVRNLGESRCVIMLIKIPTDLAKTQVKGDERD